MLGGIGGIAGCSWGSLSFWNQGGQLVPGVGPRALRGVSALLAGRQGQLPGLLPARPPSPCSAPA